MPQPRDVAGGHRRPLRTPLAPHDLVHARIADTKVARVTEGIVHGVDHSELMVRTWSGCWGGRGKDRRRAATPGIGADAEAARPAGEEIAGLLAEVGLAGIETRQLDLDPPMVLVIGTRTG